MRAATPLDLPLSFDPYYGEPDRDGDQGWSPLPDGRAAFRLRARNLDYVDSVTRHDFLDQFVEGAHLFVVAFVSNESTGDSKTFRDNLCKNL